MIYLFNKKEMVVGVLSNEAPFSCPYYDDAHIENIITGVHTYDFSIPANHEMASKVESNGYVMIRDLDGRMQMFQIKDIYEVANDYGYRKNIQCEHIAVPELLGNVLRPFSLASSTLEATMNRVLQGTGWILGEVDFTDSKDFKIEEYMTVLEGLQQVMDEYDAEVQYEVIYTNGRITKKLIHIAKERGRKTLKRFGYGKDLIEVTRKENTEGLITALVGIGKGDSNSNRINLTNYVKTLPSGYSKNSTDDYISDDEALQMYGKDGKHIMGIFVDENATTQSILFDNTLKELKERSKPSVTYSMSVVTLERITGYGADKVRIGDTILCDDETFTPRLTIEARILELTRSYTNPENDAVTIGNFKPIKMVTPASIQKIQMQISKSEEEWKSSINYTWVKYADDELGNGLSNLADGKKFIGFAFNQLVPEESTNPSDYTWALIKGADGEDGYTPVKDVDYFDGKAGQNGTSAYLWIMYSQNADGTGMTSNPTDALYIGTATTSDAVQPTISTAYSWALIKGSNGLAGEKGADGQTSYLHIKYSNDGGATFTANGGEDVGSWIGTYTDFTEVDSSNVASYTWNKVKGDKGTDGITYYTWVKYADDSAGTNMSDLPDGKKYLGLAYNKTTATESTLASDYTWSLIQGANGSKGADGVTYYTWVKYADDSVGTGMSDSPTGKVYMGLAYNKTTSVESTVASDYSWSLIKGDKGDKGDIGNTGKGVSSIVEEYYLSTSNTTQTGGAWSTTVPAWVDGNYMWTRSKITYTDASVVYTSPVCVTGGKGSTGGTGNGISSVDVQYYLSTSSTALSGGTWSTTAPAWVDGKYMWSKTVTTYTNATVVESNPACITGAKGDIGASSYTWVMYANDKNGTGITSSPTGKFWRGTAYNKSVATPSTVATDYTWEFITDGWVKTGTVEIDGGQITADSLSVISANLGTINAGTITGVTINGGTIQSNTSINVGTDLKVGNNIYLGQGQSTAKKIEFTTGAGIVGGSGAYFADIDVNADSTNIIGTNFNFGSTRTVQFDMVNNNYYWVSAGKEIGFCGCGGMGATTSAVAGNGVNFRMKRKAVPTSITLTASSSNGTGLTTNITVDGFWIYVNGDGANYKYWRGNYTING